MEIFDYDNVLLLPRKCRVESRSECDAGVRNSAAAPLRAAGGAGQHEDGGRRADRRVAGGERLLLRDAPLRPRQRRLRAGACATRACSSRSARASSRPTTTSIDRLAADGVGADYITIDIAHGHADTRAEA